MGAKFKAGDAVRYESMMGVIKSDAKVLEVIEGLSEPAYKIGLAMGGKVSPVFESELAPIADEVKKAAAEIADSMARYEAELESRIESLRGVMMGQNSVVRIGGVKGSRYLVPKDGGYGVAGILCGVVMWSPSDARLMAEHCRKSPGCEDAEAVFFADALRQELANVKEIRGWAEEKLAA